MIVGNVILEKGLGFWKIKGIRVFMDLVKMASVLGKFK